MAAILAFSAASCPLSHVPQKAWLHLFRVPFRKRHPVIFWGLLLLLLGGLAAFMVSRATGLGSERIALVRVTGPIMDIDAQLRWIDELGRMPGVKGVLVRVDQWPEWTNIRMPPPASHSPPGEQARPP